MIKTINLTKFYGDKCVLCDVNLEFKKGKVYGVLGRNGVGKTTLVNIITNRAFITSGQVQIDGLSSYENDKAQAKIFCITEKSAYPVGEKVSALFKWASKFYPNFDLDYAFNLAKKFDVEVDKRLGKLSTGYTTITKVILTLASNTPYMIFDEPVLGIDAIYREVFYEELLKKHAELDNCMILSTHIMDEIESVISEVVILKAGLVVHNAPKQDLPSGMTLQEFYLDINKRDDGANTAKVQKVTQKTQRSGKADLLKIKHSLAYMFNISWPQALIVVALAILFAIIPLVTPAEMSPEIMVLANVLFFALTLHGYYFKYALYNGVARKTYCISLMLLIATSALVFSLIGTLSVAVQHIGEVNFGILFWLYAPTSFTANWFFTLLVWLFLANILMMMFSLFAAILFQVLTRRGRYIATAIVIVIGLALMFWGMYGGASLLNVFIFLFGRIHFVSYGAAWFTIMWFAIFAATFTVASYLILKRTEIK